MSPIKSVALINKLGQVVNYVVVDTDDEETINALHERWDTHRHAEPKEGDTIILHESDEVWTTHCDDDSCENNGFTPPATDIYHKALGIETPVLEDIVESERIFKEIKINGKVYPDDSYLIKENASKRPQGWVLPEGAEEVSLADLDKE